MRETPQQYIERMLDLVRDKDPLEVQSATATRLAGLIKPLSRKQLAARPAPGKWSITEIVAHLADSEIVLGWRMRLVVGENGAMLQATDQDSWAEALSYLQSDARVALENFRVVRKINLRMLRALPASAWTNYGVHSVRGKETLADIVRLYAAHDLNHLAQVKKIAAKSSERRPGR